MSWESQQVHDAKTTDSLPKEIDILKSPQEEEKRQKRREKNLNKKFCRLSGADKDAIGRAIGIQVEDIVELTWCQLKAKMNEMNLSVEQQDLCRHIRRRGRNKVKIKKKRALRECLSILYQFLKLLLKLY